ncbi:MAG: DNA-directed RNA polymerase subunit omega [Clostridiales bacterium]|nr:DNA-directed RNA polymerase subunit omega [Clostridiales bacterium]
MILYPMNELMKNSINSRYELVNLVAHRAREISVAETADEPLTEKPVTIALNEARAGLIHRPVIQQESGEA